MIAGRSHLKVYRWQFAVSFRGGLRNVIKG